MSFDMASEMLAMEDIPSTTVVVADDVASAPKSGAKKAGRLRRLPTPAVRLPLPWFLHLADSPCRPEICPDYADRRSDPLPIYTNIYGIHCKCIEFVANACDTKEAACECRRIHYIFVFIVYFDGSGRGTRTPDTRIMIPLL